MSRLVLRRRAALTVASIAVASTALLGSTASVASAHRNEPPPPPSTPSTPVPILTPDGQLMSYVVNAGESERSDEGTDGAKDAEGSSASKGSDRDRAELTRRVERAVVRAGGVVVQSWPQIGVVVAHSERAAFRADVVRYGEHAVESVGASRTVAVSEGTPAAVPTTWGRSLAAAGTAGARVTKDVTTESAAAVAPDPREGEQWDNVQIKADQAHQVTDGSRNVIVGVLDSGIDGTHPDLKANVDVADSVNCSDAGRPDLSATGWLDNKGPGGYHGTHVAGTIGAARNGIGIVGVAPNVRLASVKVVNNDGFIYPEYAVCGFIWAGLKHMDVTNNSYFVDPFEFYCEDQPDQYAAKEAVRRAVAWSTRRGVVHAAAAGNAATDLSNNTTDNNSPDDSKPIPRTINSGCHDIPTELPGVVTVSATTQSTALASFSNRGLGVIDVAAPGRRILSTLPLTTSPTGYGLLSGTSMASPHVAGVLALMKSAHPTWKPAQLVAKVRAQADDHACAAAENNGGPVCVGPVLDNSFYGEGIVDALDAVR